ncbi:CoA ester lyase [Nocardioides immobilis]|uniref:CoA ester lyase n=1 Tax=Nocardioides immobilis TaxID=2049295 RepID=A0A417XTW4_9ACTN|nr:CoA ester lyase [Nocardioides immobilis]RHW23793.1 CoA ester lyase [Nocardioides immobilis]
MRRRAVLSVPASEPRKIDKAWGLEVDEVVIDLEDAVSVDQKDTARTNIAHLSARAQGSVAVRINALGSEWAENDIVAAVASPVVDSIVLPKAEDPAAILDLSRHLDLLEDRAGRTKALGIQALIESPRGVQQVQGIASASNRMTALIIGYADLSASLGRRIDAPWHTVQDLVLLAARAAGIQVIDGPLLTTAADADLDRAASVAQGLGFDGKWVIHPAQIPAVQRVFTPTDEEVAEAREILEAMDDAQREGRGAVQWKGRMLDEAIAMRARRVVDSARRQ